MHIHKRKTVCKIISIALIFVLLCCCSCSHKIKKLGREFFDGFSVHFLDVGEGDCIFIKFPDGKNMLIDSGDENERISSYIIDFLVDYKVKKLDYLIITHPNSDHCGNALDVINSFSVGTAFVPFMVEDRINLYQAYKSFYVKLLDIAEEIKISDCNKILKGLDYCVAFLTPLPRTMPQSSYAEFNGANSPTAEQTNALSPIIYVEYRGFRLVFTGDAPSSQEKLALEQVKVMDNFYQSNQISVNLESVDFLKVSHHGSDDASCLEFLNVLKPKNAVISVGGNNNYGHPTKKVLERLQMVNPDYKLLRTDVHGTVSVNVQPNGAFEVITDKKIA